MGEKMNRLGKKVSDLAYDHPVIATGAYLGVCVVATVYMYKVFGRIVAKEVVKALI